MLKILTGLAAAALAASALSAPAAAASADDDSIVVSYAGLDLSNPADAARLERRLKAAARAVCSDAPMLDIIVAAKVQACQDEALARARSEMRIAMRAGGSRTIALKTN